jgi:hypothetical protein
MESAEVRGSMAARMVTGEELRFAIGLKSTWVLIGGSSTAGR